MGAIQGALTPYDEAAVFTYTNGAKEWTGFTGGQSSRLPAVLSLAQATGTDPIGARNRRQPLAACPISINGNCADPNLQPGRSTQTIGQLDHVPRRFTRSTTPSWLPPRSFPRVPKSAGASSSSSPTARNTAARPPGKKWCATSKPTISPSMPRWWATRPTGAWSGLTASTSPSRALRQHPVQVHRRHRRRYYAEGNINGIERSYAKIADQARNQYTLGYLSHESIYDDKFRNIDVRVDRPNVTVIAPLGYYPSAQDYK